MVFLQILTFCVPRRCANQTIGTTSPWVEICEGRSWGASSSRYLRGFHALFTCSTPAYNFIWEFIQEYTGIFRCYTIILRHNQSTLFLLSFPVSRDFFLPHQKRWVKICERPGAHLFLPLLIEIISAYRSWSRKHVGYRSRVNIEFLLSILSILILCDTIVTSLVFNKSL